jgi:putative NIF3 family GTP cyclohydrolase 1 type 2
MKIQKLIKYIEQIAPPAYQESYDNSGLIVGDANEKITGVLLCLDSIEAVIDEATEKGCIWWLETL